MDDLATVARLPKSVEEINTAWLDSVLGGVADSKIVEVIHGTATKICVDVTFKSREPKVQRLWVKTGLEPHSHAHGMEKVYAGETLFYKELADKYETRTPKCLFAGSDADGISVVILEDLIGQGAKFKELTVPGTPEFVARGLEHMARRQAASWMAPELYANDWLRAGGSHRASDVAGWVYHPDNWAKQSKAPRFQLLPQALRDRPKLEKAMRNLQDILFLSEPWALAQGDAHFGQAYEMPDGEVRFLDWSAVQIGHWCHDVSYFMAGAMTPADRRASEEDLLKGYLGKLAEFGVARAPTMEEALPAYKAGVLHGLSWVMCPTEMQPEENCQAMAERYITAVEDLGSLPLALALSD